MARGQIGGYSAPTISAEQIANKTGVDSKALDKAMASMGPGILEQLGPQVLQYLRGVSEALNNLCDRMQEPAYKALTAQSDSPGPYQAKWFAARDTSSALPYEGRLPFNEISPENLQKAVRSGLLTREQGTALMYMFGFANPPETQVNTTGKNMQGGGQWGQGGDRGMQQDHQGSGQNPDDEWNNMELDGVSGSGSGGGSGGFGTVGKHMTGSGSAPGAGGPPPPPPGGGFGPPPAPPGSSMTGGSGGTTSNNDFQSKIAGAMQQENNYLNANFNPSDPYYGWFQGLFGSENWYRNFSASALTDLQNIRNSKQAIMAELNGIDASTPQGAKKMYILQQKLGDIQQDERQIYDHVSEAQKANNERKEMVKAVLDTLFQTSSAIIRNIAR
jgi:hypothetical protein